MYADGSILIEAPESVTCVILVLSAMSFTMCWNVVSLTLTGKSFYSANHVYCRRPGPGHLLN